MPRRLQRPGGRGAEADRRILDACLDLIADTDLGRVTIAAVAERSGVARTTIYRRYQSVDEIFLELVARRLPAVATDTGTARDDLLALGAPLVESMTDPRTRRLLAEWVAAMSRDGELAELGREQNARDRRLVLRILERSVDRGETSPDVDPDMVLDLLLGAALYRGLVRRQPLTTEVVENMIDVVLRGVIAHA